MFPLISNSTPFPSDCQTNAATLNTCAEIKIDELNKELDRLYKIKISSLKNYEYVKLLNESQTAWLEFREKDCYYQSGKSGGSYMLFLKYDCIIERTEQRIKDFRAYIECKDGGCPY